MTTATLHERDARGIFLETPEPILAACRVLLLARDASLDAVGYYESKRLGEVRRLAQKECEAVILAHQGGKSFLSGLYRVDGALVGFRKVDKGGLTLVVYPSEETKKGLKS